MDKYIVVLYSVQALVYVSTCVILALKCFEDNLRFSKKCSIIIAAVFIVVSIVFIELFFERTAPLKEYGLYMVVLWSVIAVSFTVTAVKVHFLQLIFPVFFLLNISAQGAFVSEVIYSLGNLPRGEITYILISIAVLIFMTPFMFYLLLKLFKKVTSLNVREFYLKWLFILPLAYFVLNILTGKSVYINKGWFGLIALFVSMLATFLSYVAVLQMFLKLHESHVAATKAQLSEQMIILQKEQYRQMTESIEKTAEMEHNFRHNLIAIKEFAEKGDVISLRKYLDNYEKNGVVVNTAPICKNYFVDLIIRHYFSLATDEGVKVNAKINFPDFFNMPDNELVVLLGNLLENALESCRRQKNTKKFIEIETKIISRSMVAVKVSNSSEGKLRKKEGAVISSKRPEIGIGLSTISLIAEKNGGNAEFTMENGVFTAKLLLICRT